MGHNDREGMQNVLLDRTGASSGAGGMSMDGGYRAGAAWSPVSR